MLTCIHNFTPRLHFINLISFQTWNSMELIWMTQIYTFFPWKFHDFITLFRKLATYLLQNLIVNHFRNGIYEFISCVHLYLYKSIYLYNSLNEYVYVEYVSMFRQADGQRDGWQNECLCVYAKIDKRPQ